MTEHDPLAGAFARLRSAERVAVPRFPRDVRPAPRRRPTPLAWTALAAVLLLGLAGVRARQQRAERAAVFQEVGPIGQWRAPTDVLLPPSIYSPEPGNVTNDGVSP